MARAVRMRQCYGGMQKAEAPLERAVAQKGAGMEGEPDRALVQPVLQGLHARQALCTLHPCTAKQRP